MFEDNIGLVIFAVVVAIIVITIIMSSLEKAPTNRAYIITGAFLKKPNIFTGKSGIKLPYFQRLDILDLSLIQVDVRTDKAVATKDFININVDGVANVKVGSDEESIRKASENFLNETREYIAEIAQQVLEGNLREIIGTMALTDLVHNRDAFATEVQLSTTEELRAMGLVVVNLNIQNFYDENNIINDLGIENITRIQKEASIVKAQSERDIAIAKANAEEEANAARIAADSKIAIRENDLQVEKALLKSDTDIQLAKANTTYEIAQETERKKLEIERAQAEIAKTEQEALRTQKEVEVSRLKLESTIRNEADAQAYAEIKQAEADLARRKSEADANAYEELAQAKAEAGRIREIAEAEKARAVSIRELGQAEADALRAKAEAQNLFNDAAMQLELIKVMPEVVSAVAQPLTNIDSLTLYGDGNVESLMQETMRSSMGLVSGIEQGTGINLKNIAETFLGVKAANISDDVINEESAEEK